MRIPPFSNTYFYWVDMENFLPPKLSIDTGLITQMARSKPQRQRNDRVIRKADR